MKFENGLIQYLVMMREKESNGCYRMNKEKYRGIVITGKEVSYTFNMECGMTGNN